MVRAILGGHKTQTRRVVATPKYMTLHGRSPAWDAAWKEHAEFGEYLHLPYGGGDYNSPREVTARVYCPYGSTGDLLYISERVIVSSIDDECPDIAWIRYEADDYYRSADIPKRIKYPKPGPWRGRVLPYEWNRALPVHAGSLRITDVRVQRLQDISEEDAEAEGAIQWANFPEVNGLTDHAADYRERQWARYTRRVDADKLAGCKLWTPTARGAFAALWESINSKKTGCSWEANPWVWAITFERVEVAAGVA